MALLWPFPTRSPQQEGRTDQGWDLVGPPGGPVIAVASGTIHKAGPDPGGFGTDYPVMTLDNPYIVNGKKFTDIYYGHTHMAVPPGHVNAGQVIAHTGGGGFPQGGSGTLGEVEIGFGNPNAPGGIHTEYGPYMKAALQGAGTASQFGGPGDAGTAVASGPGDLAAGFLDPIAKTLADLAAPFKVFLWFTQANHWVRLFAGGFGVMFVFFGVSMLAKEMHGNG